MVEIVYFKTNLVRFIPFLRNGYTPASIQIRSNSIIRSLGIRLVLSCYFWLANTSCISEMSYRGEVPCVGFYNINIYESKIGFHFEMQGAMK